MWSLPNILTLCNLLAGLLGIYFVFEQRPHAALLAMTLALIADYFDGLAARLLRRNNTIGKDLDSLADVVSFGALPSFMLFSLLNEVIQSTGGWISFLPFLSFAFALFGALRLAKFNQDERVADYFFGLPIPAAAIFVAGMYSLHHGQDCASCAGIFINPLFLNTSLVLLCILMVSDLPHFNLKFSSLAWKGQEVKWSFVILLLPMAVFLREIAASFAVVLYIFISLVQAVWPKKKPA